MGKYHYDPLIEKQHLSCVVDQGLMCIACKKELHTSKRRNSSPLTPRWLRKERTEVETSLGFKVKPQNKIGKKKKEEGMAYQKGDEG